MHPYGSGSGDVIVPRLDIDKYQTSKDDCIIPAEFTISFDDTDTVVPGGPVKDYESIFVQQDSGGLLVKLPSDEKNIPAAITEIEDLIESKFGPGEELWEIPGEDPEVPGDVFAVAPDATVTFAGSGDEEPLPDEEVPAMISGDTDLSLPDLPDDEEGFDESFSLDDDYDELSSDSVADIIPVPEDLSLPGLPGDVDDDFGESFSLDDDYDELSSDSVAEIIPVEEDLSLPDLPGDVDDDFGEPFSLDDDYDELSSDSVAEIIPVEEDLSLPDLPGDDDDDFGESFSLDDEYDELSSEIVGGIIPDDEDGEFEDLAKYLRPESAEPGEEFSAPPEFDPMDDNSDLFENELNNLFEESRESDYEISVSIERDDDGADSVDLGDMAAEVFSDTDDEFEDSFLEIPDDPGLSEISLTVETGDDEVPGVESGESRAEDETPGLKDALAGMAEEAEILFSQGRFGEAASLYRKISGEDPGNEAAVSGLIYSLYESGSPEAACDAYEDNVAVIPAGSGLHFLVGRAYEDLGRAGEAEVCYRRALDEDPANIGIFDRYSGLLINEGRYGEAADILDVSSLEELDSAELWIKRGDTCALSGMANDALDSYRRALETEPDNMTAVLSMLRLYKTDKKYSDASDLLEKYTREHPGDPHIWFEKGKVSEEMGDYDEAISDYDRAVSIDRNCTRAVASKALLLMKEKRAEEALECYDILIERRPGNADLYHSRALVLKVLKRYDEAAGSLEKAFSLDPSATDTLVELASMLYETGRFEEALGCYTRLREAGFSDERTLTSMGDSLRELERYEEALEVYEDAIRAGGEISGALRGKGDVFAASGRYDLAEASYGEALKLNSLDFDALMGLASILGKTGNADRAISAYDAVLAAKPGHTGALQGKLMNLMSAGRSAEAAGVYDSLLVIKPGDAELISGKASCLEKLGRKEEALVLRISAVEMNPGSPECLLNLLSLLSDLGKFEESIPYYDRLVSLVPDDKGVLMSRAMALLSVGRYSDAAEGFGRVLQKDPNEMEALLNMGMSLIRMGERRSALECYRRSINIDPSFEEEWIKRGIDASSFITWEIEEIERRSPPAVSPVRASAKNLSAPVKEKTEKRADVRKDSSYTDEHRYVPGISSEEEEEIFPGVRMPTKEQLNDPEYLYRKGIAFARKGYYRAAIKCFDRVRALSPDHDEAIFSKGIILAKNGLYEEAIGCFDAVIGINPSHEKALKARKMALMKKNRVY